MTSPAPARPESDSDWTAQWISPAEEDIGPDRPAYVLSGEFTLQAMPSDAVLFATAVGLYEAFLNGHRVGDLELTPGSTSYDRTVHAQEYPVTDLLRVGVNHLEVVLSDGWYRGRNGGMQRQDAWGATTAARAQLLVAAPDGPRVAVATDANWTSRPGAIVRADLMTGQSTDFSRPLAHPRPVVLGAVSPPTPTWSAAPGVRRIEVLPPVAVTRIAPGVSVVDFGQNISGWVRLEDLGAHGAVTELEFAEHLAASGDITTAHLDIHTPQGRHIPYRQIDRVTAGPGGDVFEPRHTVHGFRYVRIQHPGRALDPVTVLAVVVHSDLRRTGWFECSDPMVDRLHETVVWSFRGNIVDVPTDCPTRERSGWTGDFQVFAPTAAFLYDIEEFARKWLQAVRDDQYPDGSPAMFSPDSERMKDSVDPSRVGGGSAGWGDAAVLVPWTVYETHGRTAVLTESWDSMRAWVEFALRSARDGRHPARIARSEHPAPHEEFLWDATFHFGEWLEPTPTDADPVDPAVAYQEFMTADKAEVATAYLYRSTALLARIAAILGHTADAERYAELARKVRAAWRTEFCRPGGRTAQDTQAGYVRALAFELIPADQVGAAADRLVQLVAAAGGHLSTGFLSTGMLLPVLADTGHADTAYALLQAHGSPSWMTMLDRGATTVWEDWNGVDADGNATASLNHYSKGAVTGFLYSHVAGLTQEPGSTGWRHVRIRPTVGGGLTSAHARFRAPAGLIDVHWHTHDDVFALQVSVPVGIRAIAVLPDGTSTPLTPGTHHLSCALPAPTGPAPSAVHSLRPTGQGPSR